VQSTRDHRPIEAVADTEDPAGALAVSASMVGLLVGIFAFFIAFAPAA